MTSYYKSFHKKLSPLSKFRYPNKMSVEELNKYVDEFGSFKEEFDIETVTYEQKGRPTEFPLTIDFKNYVGDRSVIKDELFEYTREYLTTDMLEEKYHDIPHWTVTFNTCEKWGVHKTLPYVELTPSNEFSKSRKDRNRIIIVKENHDDEDWIDRLDDEELNNVDEQSGTPICLIDSETYYSSKYKHSKENIKNNIRLECEEFIRQLKVSNLDNLKDLQMNFVVSLDKYLPN